MKIALIGYGKMGHAVEQQALARGHEIVCRIDAGEENKFLSPEFKGADVAIEFSVPSAAVDNYRRAFAAGVPVVSGTLRGPTVCPRFSRCSETQRPRLCGVRTIRWG